MRNLLRSCAAVSAALATVLLAASPWLPLPAAWAGADLARFVGRTHPLVLHFPIVLVLLAALADAATWPVLRRVVPAPSRALRVGLLGAAAWSAALAVAAGWLLAHTTKHEEQLLARHALTGAGTAAAAMLAWLLRLVAGARLDDRPAPLVVPAGTGALVLAAALLLPAGHYGAGLTHGEDFLSRFAPRWLAPLVGPAPRPAKTPEPRALETPAAPAPAADQLVFRDVILPVLTRYCTGCHGEQKTKAKLRLDSRAAILAGGESGPAVVPGAPKDSLLVQRLHLPLADEERMPPEDKAQPTAAELTLLEWWIQAGLPGDVPLTQISVPTPERAPTH